MTTPILGAQRVRLDFNPNSNTAVVRIKRAGAALIDAINDEAIEPRCKAHPSSVDVHLTALQAKGWLRIRRDTKRGLQLTDEASMDLPLVDLVSPIGENAAGEPIVAKSRIVDRIPSAVAERFSPTPGYFLTLRGDSMDRTGLRDGDLVAIRATSEAKNGDVVVARFGDEVALKRFVRLDKRHVELRPDSHNPEDEPIRIDLAKHILHIDGVAVGAHIGRLGNVCQ